MTAELRLYQNGDLWLTQGDGEDGRATFLGQVDDPATSYRVPGELLDELGRLEVAWAEATCFRDACRAEAIATYWRNAL